MPTLQESITVFGNPSYGELNVELSTQGLNGERSPSNRVMPAISFTTDAMLCQSLPMLGPSRHETFEKGTREAWATFKEVANRQWRGPYPQPGLEAARPSRASAPQVFPQATDMTAITQTVHAMPSLQSPIEHEGQPSCSWSVPAAGNAVSTRMNGQQPFDYAPENFISVQQQDMENYKVRAIASMQPPIGNEGQPSCSWNVQVARRAVSTTTHGQQPVDYVPENIFSVQQQTVEKYEAVAMSSMQAPRGSEGQPSCSWNAPDARRAASLPTYGQQPVDNGHKKFMSIQPQERQKYEAVAMSSMQTPMGSKGQPSCSWNAPDARRAASIPAYGQMSVDYASKDFISMQQEERQKYEAFAMSHMQMPIGGHGQPSCSWNAPDARRAASIPAYDQRCVDYATRNFISVHREDTEKFEARDQFMATSGMPLSMAFKGQPSCSWNAPHARRAASSPLYGTQPADYVPESVISVQQEDVEDYEAYESITPRWTSHVNGVPVTTLIVRNLCARLRQEQLLEEWPRSEYQYDMLYVPYNVKQRCTSRYAFINFLTHEDAMNFVQKWHGWYFEARSRPYQYNKKPVEVGIAVRQGMDANVRHWKATLRTNCSAQLLPALFVGGRRQDFWEYTAHLEQLDAQRACGGSNPRGVISL